MHLLLELRQERRLELRLELWLELQLKLQLELRLELWLELQLILPYPSLLLSHLLIHHWAVEHLFLLLGLHCGLGITTYQDLPPPTTLNHLTTPFHHHSGL